jgi:hypothetical protein
MTTSPISTAPDALQAPRYALAWALLTYVLATLTLGYPALTGGFLVTPISDQYIGGFPVREFAAQSLKAGEGIPQWSPYIFGGMPYIAAMHGDIFYPTFILRALLPTDVAMTLSFMIHVVLAGLFTYVFCRAVGLSFAASLIGGLAYTMSGPIAGLVSPGHDGKLYISALLPLVLFFLIRGVRDGRMWAWGGLAVAIGLAVLSPHPQLLQYLLLTAGFFGLYLAFGEWRGVRLDRRVAVQRLGLALAAVGVGFLIGAIQYAPVLQYVDWSPRAGGKDYAHAVSYSLPLEELLNAFVPQFTGMLTNYWGRNTIHFHSEYPGVVVLVLAGAGLAAGSSLTLGGRRFRWFWIGTFAVSLLWALGGSTPFYRLIYELVPGTKFFRAPSTMMYVTMFSIAVFTALGTERVLKNAPAVSKRFLIGWAAGIVALGLLIAAGLPETVASSVGAALRAGDQLAELARANQANVVVGALRSIAFVIATLAALWAIAARRISRAKGAVLLGALVAFDLWTVVKEYWNFSPPARVLYASDPAIELMKNAPEPGRVLQFTPRGIAHGDPAFSGDALMVHGVRSAVGYHGNQLGRYDRLLAQGPRFFLGDRPEFWRHENVHYLYTTLPDSVMPQVASQLGVTGQFQKLVGPVRNAAGSTVYLYRVPGHNPASWVASVMVKGSDDQALATVLDSRFDPTRAAIIDTAATVQTPSFTTVPPPAGVETKVTRYDPGRIDVQLNSPAPNGSVLVVSENFYPGWRAAADGNNATVLRANFNLIGVVLPAGARQVQLRFVDEAYGTGRTITFIAVALALAAVAAGVILDRRRTLPAA